MDNKITDLEEYKRNLENKKKIDSGEITLDYLDLEEVEGVKELYLKEIKQLSEDIKELEKENKILKNEIN